MVMLLVELVELDTHLVAQVEPQPVMMQGVVLVDMADKTMLTHR
jgi:hypothetical protein